MERSTVLYSDCIGTPMKLVRLIKMCLSETRTIVSINRNLSDEFPIQNDLRIKEML
jgi:hypothetical protein